ncbi:MarR family winged helix-turn-helix transcriptional regulator [Comamonas endophytica]|uniref:Winged helix DNA-binding protein n=1 Tax=Comamonas endophytica TaxID=2949090 RepID=A0ABY6GFD2_9BURK|nr:MULTISPECIES: winged helix DNA-binding protein [unclassified Acidovorax]MCD2513416.1 winged helix DNA-binding protein [Acidovorax sp. D4N7]UYG53802.1 winged helix DNA-binding protein [Acidovorax sp. 5MLIR]
MQTNSVVDSSDAPGFSPARSRFGLLVASVYRQWRRQVDLSFKDLGLSDATRTPLLALYERGGPMRQKDLADALYLDSSSLVRVLAQLRQAQLVDWDCDPADRRTKCIALTDKGHETAGLILAKSLEIERTLLAGLSSEEQQVTRAVLQKISQRFAAL